MAANPTLTFDYLTNNNFDQLFDYYEVTPVDSYEDKSFKATSTFPISIDKAQDRFSFQETISDSYIKKQLLARLDSISYPRDWVNQGIKPINIQCKKLTEKVLLNLYENYHLIPTRIAPSIESAYFLKYINYDNNKELIVEIYNDLDIAALINKNKEIIFSFDSSTNDYTNDFKKITKIFKSY
ncbi:MAG: hypothetical protein GY754_40685 [bacterium]|nr:hypothetical protein [bacterium]